VVGFSACPGRQETTLRNPNANVGIATGQVSGLVVIDVDGKTGEQTLQQWGGLSEPTLTCNTSRGFHRYHQLGNGGLPSRNLAPEIDLKADGGYVVAPPSVYDGGSRYAWERWEEEIRLLPPKVREVLQANGSRRGDPLPERIPEGERDTRLTSFAGTMRRAGASEAETLDALRAVNARCDPPLPDKQIKKIARSIAKYSPNAPDDPILDGERGGSELRTRKASDIQPRRVEWLWENHLPRGQFVVFTGDPGTLKSTVSLDLAARVTRGLPMPDGTPGPLGNALVCTAEDGAEDTIVPRLIAAGADLTRVYILDGVREGGRNADFQVPVHTDALRRFVENYDIKLVVLDVFVSFLEREINSWRDQDIRRALKALAKDVAEPTGATIIALRHLTKGDGKKAIYRGGGSIGISGAARAEYLFGRDPKEEPKSTYVFACVKNSLGVMPPSMQYRADTVAVREVQGDHIVRVAWLGRSALTADQLVEDREERTEREQAKEFLVALLVGGPLQSEVVLQKAKKAGFSESTLRRAARELDMGYPQKGFGAGSQVLWKLPDSHYDEVERAAIQAEAEGTP
jgi:hypothetical protein